MNGNGGAQNVETPVVGDKKRKEKKRRRKKKTKKKEKIAKIRVALCAIGRENEISIAFVQPTTARLWPRFITAIVYLDLNELNSLQFFVSPSRAGYSEIK